MKNRQTGISLVLVLILVLIGGALGAIAGGIWGSNNASCNTDCLFDSMQEENACTTQFLEALLIFQTGDQGFFESDKAGELHDGYQICLANARTKMQRCRGLCSPF